MSGTQITMLIAMVLYLFGMMGIGIKLSERTSSVGDFYLAGRKLGPFVTAMSAEASDMSSWLLLGIPGLAYLAGIAEAGWTIIGLAVGTYLDPDLSHLDRYLFHSVYRIRICSMRQTVQQLVWR